MTFVVDASVTLAWVLDDASSAGADLALERLTSESAIEPAHWPLEVANALRAAERRGCIDEPGIRRVRALLADLPIDALPVSMTGAIATIEVARCHGLSVHDAVGLGLVASSSTSREASESLGSASAPGSSASSSA